MGKGNRGKNRDGFTPKELEILVRARKERKAVSFEGGFPSIIETSNTHQKTNINAKSSKSDTPQLCIEKIVLPNGSILGPIEDLIAMVYSLEMYASHYSESLSIVERRREDCTHELEPKQKASADIELTDERILAIGKKLQRIGEERRVIKNRFEIIKLIKRAFGTNQGKGALVFLRSVEKDVLRTQEEQRQRVYTPRTNELDDLNMTCDTKSASVSEGSSIPSHQCVEVKNDLHGIYIGLPGIPDKVFEYATAVAEKKVRCRDG